MIGRTPDEQKFEAHIESQLTAIGFTSSEHSEYDRKLGLLRNQVIDFLKDTQQDKWDSLSELYGNDVESKVLQRISSEINKRGIIDVLRNQVADRGVHLDLCYFEPKSDLNPERSELCKQNRFTVVRQLRYSVHNENSIDMVIFLNGLPILTMELKNQLTGQNFKHSENQYKNDRDPKEPLLKFKRCLVHFCVDNNHVSMTTLLAGTKTNFLPYNKALENPDVEDGYRTQYLWKEILTPTSLLDIIENFVHVSKEKEFFFNEQKNDTDVKEKELLIFPRYHQLDLIRKFRTQLKIDGVGKNYLVQHTTGSGKSYSIGWLAHTLTSLYKKKGDTKRLFDTIIVVTDRTVLDDQLRGTIRSLAKVEGVVKGVEHGSKELQQFLEQGKDIVITTIQKFPYISEKIAALGNRTFAVIIDEVHSSQSGELSKELKKALSNTGEEDADAFDYDDWLRQEIQNRGKQKHISFFGFSGTPKEKTLEVFGTKNTEGEFVPFHIFSMHQSIHEGFTLDVLQNYTTYKRYFKVKQTKAGDLVIQTRKGKRELIRYVDGHEITIRNKVQIILDHWVGKASKEIQGRARGMIVTQSRKHCVLYFQEINRQLAERGLSYRCLVGFSGEVSIAGEKYTEQQCNRTIEHEGKVPLGLKNPKYRLLVVANKFQTGFDEPLIQSMYVDKHLAGVQCVQTLSRLNRTANAKTQTFVLDFCNESADVKDSFQRFYVATILEGETDVNCLYDFEREIYAYHLYTEEDLTRFSKIFFDPKRDEGSLHPVLDRIVDKFKEIEDADTQEEIKSKIQSYLRMYGFLSQILDFTDIKLEQTFIFLKYLNRKLPKRKTDRFNIADAVDLDSLRIQKNYEKSETLVPEDERVSPLLMEEIEVQQPETALLSEIIKQANTKYGANLTEEDRVDLTRLSRRLDEDQVVENYMNGNNTEDNKKSFFAEQVEEKLTDVLNDRFDFYKRITSDKSVKDLVVNLLYEHYRKQRNQPQKTTS